jgi:hypothetical protein
VNKSPEFLATPSSVNVVENDRVELYSKVRGKPLPELIWTRGGAKLRSDRNLKIKTTRDKVNFEIESTFSYVKMSIDDEDRDYAVEASNKLDTIEHAFGIDGEL